MRRIHLKRVAIWLVPLLALLAPMWPTPAGATSTSNTRSCPGESASGSLAMPPAGFARMAEWQVAANCSLVRLPDKIVALSSITKDPQLDIIAKRWGKPSSGGDPTATVYQRSWDCCGNMMNALYTSLQWSTSGGGVYPVNQWNPTIYLNDGWYL